MHGVMEGQLEAPRMYLEGSEHSTESSGNEFGKGGRARRHGVVEPTDEKEFRFDYKRCRKSLEGPGQRSSRI